MAQKDKRTAVMAKIFMIQTNESATVLIEYTKWEELDLHYARKRDKVIS